MTIVIAHRFLKTIALFADCRVSYGKNDPVDDNLQKLYPIDNKMVLGFSGPLTGAYQVLEAIRRNGVKYSKRPIAINLLTDVERWIRHEYREIKCPDDRKDLSFILASVEAKRIVRTRHYTADGIEIPKPQWLPTIPELRMVLLKPSQSKANELVKEEKGSSKIIGVPVVVKEKVQDKIEKMFGFAFDQPKLQALAITNMLMPILMECNIRTVGGLFQCALLGENGIEWITYGLPSNFGDVTLEIINGQYVQRDNVTGRTVPLLTIWQWWNKWKENPEKGQNGIFEDPAYRWAVNNMQKDQGIQNNQNDD